MRISYWSSDVCSSDLGGRAVPGVLVTTGGSKGLGLAVLPVVAVAAVVPVVMVPVVVVLVVLVPILFGAHALVHDGAGLLRSLVGGQRAVVVLAVVRNHVSRLRPEGGTYDPQLHAVGVGAASLPGLAFAQRT